MPNYFYRDGSYKYNNKKVVVDGETFDSKKEAARYKELKLLQKAGLIKDLQRQVKFNLIPTQRGSDGKIAEYSCNYYADFVYIKDGEMVVEDCKGFKTAEYNIKRKLMRYLKGIEVLET